MKKANEMPSLNLKKGFGLKGLHLSLEYQIAQRNMKSFIVQNIPISL